MGELVYAPLGRPVDGDTRYALPAGAVDDAPVFPGRHAGDNGLGDVHLPVEVDPDIDVPVRLGHLHEGLYHAAGSRVVNKDVDAPELLYHRFDHLVDAVALGYVHLDGETLATHLLDFGGGLLGPLQVYIR